MKPCFLIALALVAGPAFAVNKCVLPNGKIEYRDGLCPSGSVGTSIRTDANTLPSPSTEDRSRAAACKPDDSPIDENIQQCKFQYYAVGDPKGQALAADAKLECLDNIALRKACRPSDANAAYLLWKDHHNQMIAKRGNLRSMNCIPTGFGMSCN